MTMTTQRPDRHRIVVLALDQVVPFDIGSATTIFRAARNGSGDQLYDVSLASVDGGPVRVAGGFQVLPEHDLSATRSADTVVVAGPHNQAILHDGVIPAEVAEALRSAAAHRRVMSICTGAFVLAAAGLLDGRRATTHWAHADRFRAMYPRVRLDPDVLFVDDGSVLTSAGVAAGVDLCLHVVRRDHGSTVANRAARRCVVPPWREGGQAQFIEQPVPEHDGPTTHPTRTWALERLRERLSLAELAGHAGMSVRTFTRRFRAETGMSPGDWLLAQRVQHARRLLEESDLAVERIAAEAGFGTPSSLRHHFRAAVGVGPHDYRRTFRHTEPAPLHKEPAPARL